MKKNLFLSLLASMLFSGTLSSSVTPEFRVSYFYPNSKTLRDIYHKGGVEYALSCTATIWKPLSIWGQVNYFSREGYSLGGHEKTKLRLIPLTLGLKSSLSLGRVELFAGLGAKYYFMNIRNYSTYVSPKIYENGLGGVAEIGSLFTFKNNFVIDLAVSYSYKTFKPKSSTSGVSTERLQYGGWNMGGGVGYRF